MKVFFELIKNIFLMGICFIVPKNKAYCVIGSWKAKRYADNSRYLYEYLNENKKVYKFKRIIWITDNDEIYHFLKKNKMSVEKKYSIKGVWYCLRAKVHIIDQSYENINGHLSYFKTRFQLWHGVGFKKLVDEKKCQGRVYKLKKLKNRLLTPGGWDRYCFLSTSSFATEKIFKYSFDLETNDYIECNYPRNEQLLNIDLVVKLDYEQQKIIDKIKKITAKKIIYMPTYRGDAYKDEKINEKFMNLNEKELREFESYIEKNNIVLLSKQHFATLERTFVKSRNIIQLDSGLDIYPLLKYTDMLITDYSSIYADYLFLDKPIIFYPYDLEKYKKLDKGFLFDYNEVTPGKKILKNDELISAIDENLRKDRYKEERKKIKIKYFGKDYRKKNMDYLVNEIIKRI